MTNEKWHHDAVCAGTNPVLFEPDTTQELKDYAKDAYCSTCPVRKVCFDTAMRDELEGVWGGTDDFERADLREGWEKENPGVQPFSGFVLPEIGEAVKSAKVQSRYRNRKGRVDRIYESFISDPNSGSLKWYDGYQLVLETMCANPERSVAELAAHAGKSTTWFGDRWRDLCAFYPD